MRAHHARSPEFLRDRGHLEARRAGCQERPGQKSLHSRSATSAELKAGAPRPHRGDQPPGVEDLDRSLQVVGQNLQAHLGSHARQHSGQEVTRSHPGLQGSEHKLHGLSAQSHGLQRASMQSWALSVSPLRPTPVSLTRAMTSSAHKSFYTASTHSCRWGHRNPSRRADIADLIPIGIVDSHAGQTLDFDPNTPTGVQLHDASHDLVQHCLQRLIGWRGHLDKEWLALVAASVRAARHRTARVDVQIHGQAEAADQPDRTAVVAGNG